MTANAQVEAQFWVYLPDDTLEMAAELMLNNMSLGFIVNTTDMSLTGEVTHVNVG